MNICKQGNGHYLNGINNQDFYLREDNLKLLMDGCSDGKFSEVGTRLFYQFFSALEDRLDAEKFEENVKTVFTKMMKFFSETGKEDATKFIVDNMLFTIIACFEFEDKFVVKYIGDGYIITVNSADMVSYIRLSYGKTPPYYAYNFLSANTYDKELGFKTFSFDKAEFKNVGIASDGIAPIVEKKVTDDFQKIILGIETRYTPEGIIKSNHSSFFDDVTILI